MDDSRSSRSPHLAVITIAVILLPLIYVLSVGPVICCVVHGYISPESPVGSVIVVIYQPLEWLSKAFPPFHALIMWYAKLWGAN
jgi:hypothetical protein